MIRLPWDCCKGPCISTGRSNGAPERLGLQPGESGCDQKKEYGPREGSAPAQEFKTNPHTAHSSNKLPEYQKKYG